MINYDKNGDIICEECGASFKRISPTHLSSHEMTMVGYRKKYRVHPDDNLWAQSYVKAIKVKKVK